jgi:hypothetical protein
MPWNSLSSFEFYKRFCNECLTLSTGVNEFLSILSTFIVRLVLNYVQEIRTQCCFTFWVSENRQRENCVLFTKVNEITFVRVLWSRRTSEGEEGFVNIRVLRHETNHFQICQNYNVNLKPKPETRHIIEGVFPPAWPIGTTRRSTNFTSHTESGEV